MRQIVNIVGVVTLNQQAALLAHAAPPNESGRSVDVRETHGPL